MHTLFLHVLSSFFPIISFLLSWEIWKLDLVWNSECLRGETVLQSLFLHSCRFPHYSSPIHWLVHGHMTSNSDCLPPNAMSGQRCEKYDVKRETVHYYREMLTAIARDQRVQVKVACCCRWNLSVGFPRPRFEKHWDSRERKCMLTVLIKGEHKAKNYQTPSVSLTLIEYTILWAQFISMKTLISFFNCFRSTCSQATLACCFTEQTCNSDNCI